MKKGHMLPMGVYKPSAQWAQYWDAHDILGKGYQLKEMGYRVHEIPGGLKIYLGGKTSEITTIIGDRIENLDVEDFAKKHPIVRDEIRAIDGRIS